MSGPSHLEERDDEDPVVAEYDVFITPELSQQIYLMQYPTRKRHQPYNAENLHMPLEMRTKPNAGFMELDIGLDVNLNFDRRKGVVWGEALRMTKEAGTDSFGLASGFGKGTKANEAVSTERAQFISEDSDRVERLLSDFGTANGAGRVLKTQTLGGQIIQPQPGRPMYMLGTFRDKELHLSTVTGLVQMRPQFHHIDARTQLAKAKKANERVSTDNARATESRLITQRAHTGDDEELNVEKTDKFMRNASAERWMRLKYHDENADEAYSAFEHSMFIADTASSKQLKSPWTNDEFLDAISMPIIEPGNKAKRKPPLTRKQMADMNKDADDD